MLIKLHLWPGEQQDVGKLTGPAGMPKLPFAAPRAWVFNSLINRAFFPFEAPQPQISEGSA